MPERPSPWKWLVSGLLLTATMINYMDRQTLANVAVRVKFSLGLSEEQYGDLEYAFGWAFATGSLIFGFLVDYLSVRWLYPIMLLGWSAAGILTGFAHDYYDLLVCRTILGFFEAGHWPCALLTIQRVMDEKSRHFSNSLLQSGAAFGAILTPPIILSIIRFYDPFESDRLAHQAIGGGLATVTTGVGPQVWSLPFIIVGAVGSVWVIVWLAVIRDRDLRVHNHETENKPVSVMNSWTSFLRDRRFWALLIMVTVLNATWQTLRAWLPKYMQQGRGYSEAEALWFNSAFYIAADVGCILSGVVAYRLARMGLDLHRIRIGVYASCTLLTTFAVVLSSLPNGPVLMLVLLLIGAGALGLFPCYYSFCQMLSQQHIGKFSGILASLGWFISSPLHKLYGRHVDATQSFELGIALSGVIPVLGLIGILIFWRNDRDQSTP